MRNQPQNASRSDAAGFLAFRPDPGWYDVYWLRERPLPRKGRAGRHAAVALATAGPAIISFAFLALKGATRSKRRTSRPA